MMSKRLLLSYSFRLASLRSLKIQHCCSISAWNRLHLWNLHVPLCHQPCIQLSSQNSGAPPPVSGLSDLTAAEFDDVCDETLDSIAEKFEDLGDQPITSDNFDVNFASGVITIKLGEEKGTYVINKQGPNKQIWLSSPKSGPKRYDFIEGEWIYKHDGVKLHDLLTCEISDAFDTSIDFTNCAHGKNS